MRCCPKLKWEVSTSNNNEIGLSSEKSSLCIGESTQLSVSNYTGNITWISSDTEVAKISVDGIVTGAGEGNATIYAILESGKSLCCNIHVIKEAFILGDINGDNDVNISDVVELQKWLLAVSDTEFANWQVADICKDGIINGFDLVALKEVVSSEN